MTNFIQEGMFVLVMVLLLLAMYVCFAPVNKQIFDTFASKLDDRSLQTLSTMEFSYIWFFIILLIGYVIRFFLSAFVRERSEEFDGRRFS